MFIPSLKELNILRITNQTISKTKKPKILTPTPKQTKVSFNETVELSIINDVQNSDEDLTSESDSSADELVEKNTPERKVLEMIKTDHPDVYKLKGRNKKNQKVDVGNAFIDTTERSRYCHELFEHKKSVFVKCEKMSGNGRWKPLELVKNIKILITNLFMHAFHLFPSHHEENTSLEPPCLLSVRPARQLRCPFYQ